MTSTLVITNEFTKFVDEPIGIVIIVLIAHVLISITITIITVIVSKKR